MKRKRSKRRSATSSRPAQLPRLPPIYIDESLSQHYLPEALKGRDVDVIVRADVFRQGVADPEWLDHAGRHGWIILTKDKAIRKRPNEIRALLKAGVRAFVLSAGKITGPDQAELFVRMLPVIRRFVAETPPPFVVKVTKQGTTELLATKSVK